MAGRCAAVRWRRTRSTRSASTSDRVILVRLAGDSPGPAGQIGAGGRTVHQQIDQDRPGRLGQRRKRRADFLHVRKYIRVELPGTLLRSGGCLSQIPEGHWSRGSLISEGH